MSSDGFSTLSGGLMQRGTDRVQALLGNGGAMPHNTDQPQRRSADHSSDANGTQRPSARPTAQAAPQPAANGSAPKTEADEPGPAENGAENTEAATSSKRANSGSTLMIAQPPSGDMSEVTISLWGAKPEHTDTPSKNGQRPTSVTYERCTVDEDNAQDADSDEEERQLWIDTPTFSGPDRRHHMISPEVERRKSVPPRLKVGVRLEQERYLRLKLASQDTKRTQQDIITSAMDAYLDDIGVDRFVRIAMGFGGATPTIGQTPDATPPVETDDD